MPPDAGPLISHAMLMRRLCGLLIAKGVLSQPEAASVFTEAAREVREGSEDDVPYRRDMGELQAQTYEQMAHWLLGYKDVL